MATDVTLPALGESVTEGTVTQWLKSVGDDVAVDEPLLEVSTDKVDTEIPSPVAGKLLEIKAAEDETVEVGAVLAVIGDDGDSSGGGTSEEQSDGGGDSSESQDQGEDQAAAEPTPEDQPDEAPSDGDGEEPRDESPSEEAPTTQADTSSSGGDSVDVKLPELGESVTEGTVTQWLKSVGDDVAVDEPLLEVSTDKVDTEIPSPVAGKLLEIKAAEDETVAVGAVLAVIGSGSAAAGGSGGDSDQAEGSHRAEESAPREDATPAEEPESAKESEPAEKPAPAEEPAASTEAAPEPSRATRSSASAESDSRSYVTPLVRKLAAQHNIDLSSLSGTGVGGRIRKQDVLE
ncbi:MAG: biotin/lipoyl-containing protein, partial [Nocardioidaceae bacterium]